MMQSESHPRGITKLLCECLESASISSLSGNIAISFAHALTDTMSIAFKLGPLNLPSLRATLYAVFFGLVEHDHRSKYKINIGWIACCITCAIDTEPPTYTLGKLVAGCLTTAYILHVRCHGDLWSAHSVSFGEALCHLVTVVIHKKHIPSQSRPLNSTALAVFNGLACHDCSKSTPIDVGEIANTIVDSIIMDSSAPTDGNEGKAGYAELNCLILKAASSDRVSHCMGYQDSSLSAIRCDCGHPYSVSKLLPRGIVMPGPDKCGITALMIAAYNGRHEVLRILLKHDKTGINLQSTKHGYTALMNATKNDNKTCVELLVAAGAAISIAARHGETTLYFAHKHSDRSVMCILVDAMEQRIMKNADINQGHVLI